jgi:hypothetical protein
MKYKGVDCQGNGLVEEKHFTAFPIVYIFA